MNEFDQLHREYMILRAKGVGDQTSAALEKVIRAAPAHDVERYCRELAALTLEIKARADWKVRVMMRLGARGV